MNVPLKIEPNDRIEPTKCYCVSGRSIVELDTTTGKVRKLEGTEAERVRRWLLRKAAR